MKTIEQVKKHFKNAKIVKDSDGDTVDFSKTNIDDTWKGVGGGFYISNRNDATVVLWSAKSFTYAEIVEYTTPKEWNSDELEFFHTSIKKWVTLGNGTSKIRFKIDNSEKILTLENQKLDIERQISELRC